MIHVCPYPLGRRGREPARARTRWRYRYTAAYLVVMSTLTFLATIYGWRL